MRIVIRSLISLAAVAAILLVPLGVANARDWHHRHHGNDALALGVLGLAAGAIIGGAIASDRAAPVYDAPQPAPPPADYYPPAPEAVYVQAPAYAPAPIRPWTRDWYAYCADTYGSFDPARGTYVGYDGEEHFCTAN